MAYGTSNNNSRGSYGNNRPAAQSTDKKPASYLFRTGLFAPTKEGAKSLGSIQVKEQVVIPAGSYINVYPADRKNDKSPALTLTVKEGKLAPRK